ncbi:DUF6268 family outer membrane beta-barrel protein [Chitinibacter sp. GC72]|uniref:DUF6268 family outer membrane beta-barrel protein n=1 Tax=Chitinibacter sp. GC72 TaxID=1526917 RepID=UPI0012FA4E19|nr:DUF6268 family outer membrane beta-barrel protein [Chitinibacter sp. GC72]
MFKYGLIGLLLAHSAGSALAGDQPAGLEFNYSLSSIRSGEFDLDSGGQAKTRWLMGSVGIKTQLDRQNSIGIDFSAARQHWDFENPRAWGGKTPWQTIEQASIGLSYTHATQDGWIYSFAPSVGLSGEKDAKRSDSYHYGASGFVAKSIAPDLLIGLGLGAYRTFDETSVFPFVVVNWQITPTVRLSNPFSAGAVGPAGVELSWAATPQLELGTGTTIRSYSSRLAKNNKVAAGGVLEQTSMPLFVRAGYRFSPALRLDSYIGSAIGGEMRIRDEHGHEVRKEKHDAMPFVAVSFSGEF